MERMTALDAGFWELEDEHTALHIGAVAVFEGPPPGRDEITRRYAGRIASMPRYRQRMRTVPLGLSWPVWADDPDFDLSYHVRCTALAAPGSEEELFRLVGRLMSTHLDQARPLWEAWVVEGLADDRWALVTKVHHSMVDGIAGMDIFAAMLDPAPGLAPRRRPMRTVGRIQVPGGLRLVVGAVSDAAVATRRALRGLGSVSARPVTLARFVVDNVRGSLGYVRAVRPFRATSLAGPLGTPRRYRATTVEIADVSRVRHAFGGSLNDVVLGIVTSGFRDLLEHRGEPLVPDAVRCLVPVSVRSRDEKHPLANKVSALVVDLPVDFADATAAYGAVSARMRELKRSHEAQAGELVTFLAGFLPAPVVAAAWKAALHVPHRVLTTVVTNVPGPRGDARLLGHRMIALYPYVPIADRIRIGVAVASYDHRLFFGITCDRDSVPDADVLTAGIQNGLLELLKAADAAVVART